LPVVLCGYEIWSLILRKERRLRVFNRVPRRTFEPKGDEVTGKWIRLHNKSFTPCTRHQYYSGDQIKKNQMCRTCSTYGKRRGGNRALVRKPEGRIQLGKTRLKWECNKKIDLQEEGCGTRPGLI
jgi:hypothetical protein